MGKDRGSLLIVVVWVMALLLLLAVGLAYRAGLELQMTRYAKERLEAFYIAKAGLQRAVTLLTEEDAPESDSFQDDWSGEESLFKAVEAGGGTYSIFYTLSDADKEEIRYGIEDEESRVPLNLANADILRKVAGLEEEGLLSLRAWRGDPDLTPEQLATEDEYYASLEKPYPRKGKPFETLEELLLVKGMTPSLFETFSRRFTVYGSGKVNLNTASNESLVLLGLDEEIARRFSEARRGDDGVPGTEDDYVFEQVSELISPEVIDLLQLDQDQQIALTNFLTAHQTLLSVQSSAFRIQVEGRLRQGFVKKRIVTVVDRSRKENALRYWHED